MIKINHIAIVVPDLEAARHFWADTLGLPVEWVGHEAEEAVDVAFLSTGAGKIELVQPTDPQSGVSRYLEKRGPGMHHLCLEVEDIEGVMRRLRAEDVELINEQPRVGRNGRRYAFVHPRSTGGVLLELYEAAPA